jgi:hypothetical protein
VLRLPFSFLGKGKLNVQFAKRKAISAETAGAPTEFTGAPKNAITRKTAQQKTLIRKAVKCATDSIL